MRVADLSINSYYVGDGDRVTRITLKIGALEFNFNLTDHQKLTLLELLCRGRGEMGLEVDMKPLLLPNKREFKTGPYFAINESTMAVREVFDGP